MNISICNAEKQRNAATYDLFRIYVRFVSPSQPSEIPKTSGFAGFNHSSPILSFIPAATSAE
ncbi:MAG: hypothetical protein IJQ11_12045 [Bacteroidales bacterium]|nr:hypothetical protein [Bacteroidales bacterium]